MAASCHAWDEARARYVSASWALRCLQARRQRMRAGVRHARRQGSLRREEHLRWSGGEGRPCGQGRVTPPQHRSAGQRSSLDQGLRAQPWARAGRTSPRFRAGRHPDRVQTARGDAAAGGPRPAERVRPVRRSPRGGRRDTRAPPLQDEAASSRPPAAFTAPQPEGTESWQLASQRDPSRRAATQSATVLDRAARVATAAPRKRRMIPDLASREAVPALLTIAETGASSGAATRKPAAGAADWSGIAQRIATRAPQGGTAARNSAVVERAPGRAAAECDA
jgi:hypothetical protein